VVRTPLAAGPASCELPARFVAADARCETALIGHSDFVTSVAYSPDGKQAVTGSNDNIVMLWDVASRACKAKLKGHNDAVESVCFSPDGILIASASWDKTVRLCTARQYLVYVGRISEQRFYMLFFPQHIPYARQHIA
jgi:WD40 repeat protein